MSEKKPYSTPQLFRVDLNHEQAILSACSLLTTALIDGAAGQSCRANCKSKMQAGGGDSSARAS